MRVLILNFGSMDTHGFQKTNRSSSSKLGRSHHKTKPVPTLQIRPVPHHNGFKKHGLGQLDWYIPLHPHFHKIKSNIKSKQNSTTNTLNSTPTKPRASPPVAQNALTPLPPLLTAPSNSSKNSAPTSPNGTPPSSPAPLSA